MTLEKAIEILNLYEHTASSIPREDFRLILYPVTLDFLDAIKLAIEALKIYKRLEQAAGDSYDYLLPGETKSRVKDKERRGN